MDIRGPITLSDKIPSKEWAWAFESSQWSDHFWAHPQVPMWRGTGTLGSGLPTVSNLDSLLQTLLLINSPHLPQCSQLPPFLQRLTPTWPPSSSSAQLLPWCIPGNTADPPPAWLTAQCRAVSSRKPPEPDQHSAVCLPPGPCGAWVMAASIPSLSKHLPPCSRHSSLPDTPTPTLFFALSLSSFPSYLLPISFTHAIGTPGSI